MCIICRLHQCPLFKVVIDTNRKGDVSRERAFNTLSCNVTRFLVIKGEVDKIPDQSSAPPCTHSFWKNCLCV